MNLRMVGGIFAGVIVMAMLMYAIVRSVWLGPRAELLEQRSELRGQVAQLIEARERLRAVETRIDNLIATTLGSDVQTVDHRLRTRLNRLAEVTGIAGAVVGTENHVVRLSPARAAMPRAGDWSRLRDEPDFSELVGTFSGEGTLAQVVELLDRIDAEPWIKRIDYLRVDPRDGGSTFAVTLRLITLFLDGRQPPEMQWPDWEPARVARLQPLISSNPFRIPPPPPPAPEPIVQQQPRPQPPPPAPPPFPWGDWVLTGVAAQGDQIEAWVRNVRSGEARRLMPGDVLNTAQLTGIVGEGAHFRMPDGIVRVDIGQNFAERRRAPES